MELTNRKKRILRAIVEIYISTAEPVGSKAVAEQAGLDISTATIRNEMANWAIWSSPTPRPDGFRPPWATGSTSTSSWVSTS